MFVAVIFRLPGGTFAKMPKSQAMPAMPIQTSIDNLSSYFAPWPKQKSKYILYGGRRFYHSSSKGVPSNAHNAVQFQSKKNTSDVENGGEFFLYGPNPGTYNRAPVDKGKEATDAGSTSGGYKPVPAKPLGLAGLMRRFQKGQKLSMVTAYDFPSGRLARDAGTELVLVGDSLGNCRLGLPDTVGVTMEDMLRATSAVRRGIDAATGTSNPKPVLVGDMPFGSYLLEADALRNAAAFRIAGADMIKLEGGSHVAPLVQMITKAGIAVMGHIGLEPQHALLQGGLKLQGTTAGAAMDIVENAKSLASAGAVAIVVECVPAEVGRAVQLSVPHIPVIGIGAGGGVGGQVLVCDDLVGLHGSPPSFVKKYANLAEDLKIAYSMYVSEVRNGDFPAEPHSRSMKPSELEQLQELLPHISIIEETSEAVPAKAETSEKIGSSSAAKSIIFPDRWSYLESHKGMSGIAMDQLAYSPIWSKMPGRHLMGARNLQTSSGPRGNLELAILRDRGELRTWRRSASVAGRQVALVPTMGNLHEGHLELVDEAKKHADDVIVTIFVNPAQFAAHEDLDKYPRTMERDLELLQARGVAAVFTPAAVDIYPEGSPGGTMVVPTFVEGKSEAACRPEHFPGVATVCLKLFNLCEPNFVIFGQKDAMQCCVIDRMLKDLMLDDRISLVVAPTSREKDGLARSSRNSYLSCGMRQKAPAIHAALIEAVNCPGATPGSVRNSVRTVLSDVGMEVSYVSVAHSSDMSEKDDEDSLEESIVSIACLLRDGDQECRLIDNIVVSIPSSKE